MLSRINEYKSSANSLNCPILGLFFSFFRFKFSEKYLYVSEIFLNFVMGYADLRLSGL